MMDKFLNIEYEQNIQTDSPNRVTFSWGGGGWKHVNLSYILMHVTYIWENGKELDRILTNIFKFEFKHSSALYQYQRSEWFAQKQLYIHVKQRLHVSVLNAHCHHIFLWMYKGSLHFNVGIINVRHTKFQWAPFYDLNNLNNFTLP
jgi:hypothetical protein